MGRSKSGDYVIVEESVKERIAAEVCSGKISQAEASRQYGIHRATIWEWVQLYGRVKHRRVVEIIMSDQKDKIAELEKALGQAHLKLQVYENLITIAKTKYKIDLKKNIGTNPLEQCEEADKAASKN